LLYKAKFTHFKHRRAIFIFGLVVYEIVVQASSLQDRQVGFLKDRFALLKKAGKMPAPQPLRCKFVSSTKPKML